MIKEEVKMIRIILCGCQGKMGKMVTELAGETDDVAVVAGVDIKNDLSAKYPVYSKIADVKEQADAIVDFSHPSLLEGILEFATARSIPVLIATTGNSDSNIARIKKASEKIPVFFSSNMTIGISLLTELALKAKQVLGDDFDIEIVEKHHNSKLDAPSGTALMIADALNESGEYTYTYDRHSERRARSKNEIGISSIRGGTIVGEHIVMFAGKDEVIELKHTAFSRNVFASGALRAVKWLVGRENGLYSMKDLV